MAQVLFINRDDLVRFTSANGNIDTDKFIQYIFIAQEIQIQRFLGTELYQQLETKITNNNFFEIIGFVYVLNGGQIN